MIDVVSVGDAIHTVRGSNVEVLCLFVVPEEPVPSFTHVCKEVPVGNGVFKAYGVCAFPVADEAGSADEFPVFIRMATRELAE